MSRAVNIDETVQVVTDRCAKLALGSSVIEPLTSGGTRVVVNTAAEADKHCVWMKSKLIDGPATRSTPYPFRARRPGRAAHVSHSIFDPYQAGATRQPASRLRKYPCRLAP